MSSHVEPDPRLPEHLAQLYGHLAGALIEAYRPFDELVYLYATSSDIVKILNEVAPAFFVRYQHLIVVELILSVSRLTDNPTSGSRADRQENLPLDRLFLGLEVPEHFELRQTLSEKWQGIRATSSPIRLYRHKLIAHADLVHYITTSTDLGENITIARFRKILSDIADYLNTFDSFFTHTESMYGGLAEFGGAEDLVSFLRKRLKC